jgi:hypothetical protein
LRIKRGFGNLAVNYTTIARSIGGNFSTSYTSMMKIFMPITPLILI